MYGKIINFSVICIFYIVDLITSRTGILAIQFIIFPVELMQKWDYLCPFSFEGTWHYQKKFFPLWFFLYFTVLNYYLFFDWLWRNCSWMEMICQRIVYAGRACYHSSYCHFYLWTIIGNLSHSVCKIHHCVIIVGYPR